LEKDILVWLYKFATFNYDKTFLRVNLEIDPLQEFFFLTMRQQKLFLLEIKYSGGHESLWAGCSGHDAGHQPIVAPDGVKNALVCIIESLQLRD
jgi:hypothetical protein